MQLLTRANAEEPIPTLKRVLGLWDLVFYGIVLIQPIAAVGLFGIGMRMSDGQMVTTLLIAMVAMMLTAVSYGRMASMYPSAGSAYTYVTRGLNVHLGFLAGWAMVLDYLIVPIVSTVYGALTLGRLVPQIPYFVWVLVICLGTTALNIRGIRTTARSNIVLLGCMCVVIAAFFVLSIRYVWVTDGAAALFSVRPLYSPQTFNLGALFTATSFVALTYIGFDGVTTLAEDATNPRRTVLLATTLVCAITGVFSALQIYLASLVWPAYSTFPNIETAFLDVCRRAGGPWLFHAMALTLIVACVGTALAGQVGSARLLLGMGRDSVLVKRYFGSIDPRTNTPLFNILFVGAITIAGSLSINYESAAEVLNFGAFLAFMGVNAAVIRSFYFARQPSERHFLPDVVAPAVGFLFCLAIWCSLPAAAKWIGGGWTIAGLLYQAVRTRGFTRRPVALSFPGESAND